MTAILQPLMSLDEVLRGLDEPVQALVSRPAF
jgi:hypothetical protein